MSVLCSQHLISDEHFDLPESAPVHPLSVAVDFFVVDAIVLEDYLIDSRLISVDYFVHVDWFND